MTKLPSPAINIGGWKSSNRTGSELTMTNDEDHSGNEDPNRKSFASIDHGELVRLRFEAKQQNEQERKEWSYGIILTAHVDII